MIGDFFFALVIEFIRALLIDELSDHVRGRIGVVIQARRRRCHSKKALRFIRSLSTGKGEKVR
jgi:hypothetical protein